MNERVSTARCESNASHSNRESTLGVEVFGSCLEAGVLGRNVSPRACTCYALNRLEKRSGSRQDDTPQFCTISTQKALTYTNDVLLLFTLRATNLLVFECVFSNITAVTLHRFRASRGGQSPEIFQSPGQLARSLTLHGTRCRGHAAPPNGQPTLLSRHSTPRGRLSPACDALPRRPPPPALRPNQLSAPA